MALKDQILAAQDIKTKPVATPEWPDVDGQLFVRTLSAAAREAVDDAYTSVDDNGKITFNRVGADARLLVRCLVDADGERVFDDDDVAALGEKSAPVIGRLASKARDLNSIGADEQKVAEAGKDSEQDQPDSSSSS